MSWPPPESEAQKKLFEALYLIEDIYGDQKTIRLLEQEITRLQVISSLQSQRQKLLAPPPPSAPTQSAADVNIAVDALKFYGEETNYDIPKTGRDKRSAIAKDGGQMARNTLATLAQDEEETGDDD